MSNTYEFHVEGSTFAQIDAEIHRVAVAFWGARHAYRVVSTTVTDSYGNPRADVVTAATVEVAS